MGYTHYWKMTKFTKEDTAGFYQACSVLRQLFERHADLICTERIQGKDIPLITPNEIVFNGIGEDAHETFMFRMPDKDRLEAVRKSQNDSFMNDFCKTARKPYDLVVCLSLLTLRAYMPNLEL